MEEYQTTEPVGADGYPALGNQAMQRLLQNGLKVDETGDRYEREADQIAGRIMSGGAGVGFSTGVVHRAGHDARPPIGSMHGAGRPLPRSVRSYFEPRLGHDFSAVRIHDDARAGEAARTVNARAFTLGRNIVFGKEEYVPNTGRGNVLLAHELVHVMQQNSGRVRSAYPDIQRKDDAKKPAASTCRPFDVFTELNPGAVLPSAYFRNGTPLKKAAYKSQLNKAKKGKCETEANFEDILLKWDLGNPKLGRWYLIDINKGSKSIDIENTLVYRSPGFCCECFSGSLTWSIGVSATRVFDKGKKSERKEHGKTKKPLAGTKTIGECTGKICCYVDETFPLELWLGDDEVSIDFKGTAKLKGTIYEEED